MNPNYPRPDIPIDQLRELDVICDRFEQAWKNQQQPKIVEFVADHGGPSRSELVRQLLEVEFEQRMAQGETPKWEDYQGQFPSLSDWIQERLHQLTSGREDITKTTGETGDPGNISNTAGDASNLIGSAFGKYVVVDLLGQGGMGAVYRARHSMIQCERALKLLRPHLADRPDAVKRFLLEAQACVEMSHPNIVTTYHVDQEADGTIYLVMELLDGENLDQLVKRAGPLEYALAAKIIRQTATGLEYAHRRGAVHRDIKPHNIIWTGESTAKILDLGLVHILDEPSPPVTEIPANESHQFNLMVTRFQTRLTNSQALIGTLPYMSPEQAADARSADNQSDIYSLGCTLYFLLTGRHAFAGATPEEIVRKHLDATFDPVERFRPDIPAVLNQILARMMTRDRDYRFDSAAEVEQSLSDWEDRVTGKRAAPPILSEPVDLEDVDALRQALLKLRIVSENDWETAQVAADRIREGKIHNRLSQTSHFEADEFNAAAPILQQLQFLQNERSGQKYGLSEFQMRHILNGNLDLLRLPHHVLQDQLGRGWKGEVFKARNLEADRVEAVRTFSPRVLEGFFEEGRARVTAFHEEVQKLAALEHPSAARVYASGEFENRHHGELVYLAGQFVYGDSLAALVLQPSSTWRSGPIHQSIYGRSSTGGPVDEYWLVGKIRDVCRVLEFAHAAGVLHLDLHAGAIKIDRSGQVKLLDLGIASMLTRRERPKPQFMVARGGMKRSAMTEAAPAEAFASHATGTIEPPPVGTAQIMPPEQWKSRKHVSPATDIYNLGCTLFFALTGHYPFEGTGALELMEQHLSNPPLKTSQAKHLPKILRPVLQKALAKSPEQRYRTAGEMADALDEFLASTPPTDDHRSKETQETKSWFSRLTPWSKR